MTFDKPTVPPPCKSGAWLAGLLIIIVAAIYAPSLNAPFLVNWDDGAFILNNPHSAWSWQNALHYLTHPFQNLYTPTPMLSLMADVAVFGHHPFGYRLHNLGAHLLATLLLYAILRKLRTPPWGAFFGALLWAIHPQRVESVCWIVERKDLACALFSTLAIYCFLLGREARRPWPWQLLAVLAATISLGGKPASAALPAAFLLIAYALNHGDWRKTARDAAWPALGSACALCFVLWMTKLDNPGHVIPSLLIPAHNLGWYPITALLPCPPLHPIYPPPHGWQEALPWLAGGILLATALLWLSRRIHRRWTPGLIALLLTGGSMLPVLGLLQYTDFAYCDRYNHIVALVLWGSLAALFTPWLLRRHRRLTLALLAACAIAEGTRTLFYHQTVWQSDETLAIYCLTRPGKPNLKALELSLAAGFSHANPELLMATASAYLYHQEWKTFDGHSVPPELRDALVTALLAHANFLKGDRATAAQYLAQFEAMRPEELARHSFSLHFALEFLYRDLAALAADRRDAAAALHYLELEAPLLSPNPDHPATRQNRELRELLRQEL